MEFAATQAASYDMSDSKLPRRSSYTSSRSEGVSTYTPSVRQKSADDAELYMAGQALVPVVNNPGGLHRVGSGSYGLLSWPASAVDKAWAEASIPPPSALHREVSYSHFDEYRTRVGTLVERYLHKRMSVQQDTARRLSVADPEGSGYLRGEGLVQALRQVPSLYFQEDFSLTRPETFSQVVRGDTPEERGTTLEMLNNALDIVETELLNEIAARSDSFFEAAESLQELQQSMGDTLFQIKRLQIHAHDIDNAMCSRAGYIQLMHKKRHRLEATLELLRTMETVTQAQDAVNLLLLAHDYPSALDLIENLQQQYEDQTLGPFAKGMEKLLCLKSMPETLKASVVSLRACLIGEMPELFDWDAGEAVVRSVAAKALGEECRFGSSLCGVSAAEEEVKKEKLKQILVGLSRTGSVSEIFREIVPHAVARLDGSLRNVMEILIPNFAYGIPHGEPASPERVHSDQLQCLTHEMFLSLLRACFSVASACLGHYRLLGERLLEATDDGKVLQHRAAVERGRSDMCQALVETSHVRWTKLFQSRTDAHQKLSLTALKELVDLTEKCQELATAAEVRSAHKLVAMLQPLCRSVMTTGHQSNLRNLQQRLDEETWKITSVQSAIQARLNETFFERSSLTAQLGEEDQMVRLGGMEYHVVQSGQELLLMICSALQHHRDFPDFVTETARHVIELVTLFNKRSCQLVLGAQAMQVSGLKSITAKHLALCSQSILFLVHLHPFLMEALLSGCSQSKKVILQPEAERLKQDLLMHLDGIHSKLISIMKERVLIGIEQLRADVKGHEGTKDSGVSCPPSQASQQIAKQLRILTQVLTPILHEQQMSQICRSVAEIFSQELGRAFDEMIIEFGIENLTQETLSPEEIHPLNSPSEAELEERQKSLNQRALLQSDCHFLIDILSKLPVGEGLETIMAPLYGVANALS